MSRGDPSSSPAHQPPLPKGTSLDFEALRTSEERLRIENEHLRESLAELERARDEYFDLYDIAPLPLLTLDASGLIRYVNLAMAALLEQERNRILGRTFRSFVALTDRPLLSQHLLASRTASPITCELHLQVTEGVAVPVRLWSGSSVLSSGVLMHVALFDQREQERLAQEKLDLLEAAKVARKDNASKDQFIAMLSHELRTPLTPILAAASAFKEDANLPPAVRAIFERIAHHAAAEARLVDDLLDANGILRGKMSVQRQPTDVEALLRECVELARADAQAKQQDIRLELGADEQYVLGDAVRLRQVFSNLIRNAIKFTPNSGCVHIRSWNCPGRLVVDVEDNGVGFEEAAIPRLFDPFDQVSDGRTTRGGLGLGLAISRGLVELHEGRIEAASRGTGYGARFAVELPTIPAPEAPLAAASPAPTSQGFEASAALTVLLVEDHADTAELFAQLLEIQGYKVVLAGSVAQALAIPPNDFEIIISDLGLPDGTGIELIEKLQAVRRRPAIALSGFGMNSDVQAAKRAGFDIHLTKPIGVAALLAALQQLPKQHGTQAP